MKKSPAKKSGFTLIEIVIVLAIAALIMVIVFVAVAGAQRSRRDTEKKATASRVVAALVQCAADNSGRIGAGTPDVFCNQYLTTAGAVNSTDAANLYGAPLPTSTNQTYITAGRSTGVPAACNILTANSTNTLAGTVVCAFYYSEGAGSVQFVSSSI